MEDKRIDLPESIEERLISNSLFSLNNWPECPRCLKDIKLLEMKLAKSEQELRLLYLKRKCVVNNLQIQLAGTRELIARLEGILEPDPIEPTKQDISRGTMVNGTGNSHMFETEKHAMILNIRSLEDNLKREIQRRNVVEKELDKVRDTNMFLEEENSILRETIELSDSNHERLCEEQRFLLAKNSFWGTLAKEVENEKPEKSAHLYKNTTKLQPEQRDLQTIIESGEVDCKENIVCLEYETKAQLRNYLPTNQAEAGVINSFKLDRILLGEDGDYEDVKEIGVYMQRVKSRRRNEFDSRRTI